MQKGMNATVEMAKVTSKGQITIPVSIRRRLGIEEGAKLLFIDSPDGVVMVNPDMLNGGQAPDANQTDIETGESAAHGKSSSADAETADAVPLSDTVAAPTSYVSTTPTHYDPPKAETKAPSPADDASIPARKVNGFDIGALLDEIRSIGSKI